MNRKIPFILFLTLLSTNLLFAFDVNNNNEELYFYQIAKTNQFVDKIVKIKKLTMKYVSNNIKNLYSVNNLKTKNLTNDIANYFKIDKDFFLNYNKEKNLEIYLDTDTYQIKITNVFSNPNKNKRIIKYLKNFLEENMLYYNDKENTIYILLDQKDIALINTLKTLKNKKNIFNNIVISTKEPSMNEVNKLWYYPTGKGYIIYKYNHTKRKWERYNKTADKRYVYVNSYKELTDIHPLKGTVGFVKLSDKTSEKYIFDGEKWLKVYSSASTMTTSELTTLKDFFRKYYDAAIGTKIFIKDNLFFNGLITLKKVPYNGDFQKGVWIYKNYYFYKSNDKKQLNIPNYLLHNENKIIDYLQAYDKFLKILIRKEGNNKNIFVLEDKLNGVFYKLLKDFELAMDLKDIKGFLILNNSGVKIYNNNETKVLENLSNFNYFYLLDRGKKLLKPLGNYSGVTTNSVKVYISEDKKSCKNNYLFYKTMTTGFTTSRSNIIKNFGKNKTYFVYIKNNGILKTCY